MNPTRVLMAGPEHFDLLYAINPFMKTASGELQKADRPRARGQWEKLRDKYGELGLAVDVMEAPAGFPDFVFCANQSFPFWDEKARGPAVVMGRMRSEKRQGEVAYFEEWFRRRDYRVHHLDSEHCFEGNGDALIQPGHKTIWGGWGPRTDKEVYGEIEAITGYRVELLPLTDPRFYHLDTCFAILNEDTVVIQPRAFPEEAVGRIRRHFKTVIETDAEECARFFTGNCHSPNGLDVILQAGNPPFEEKLRQAGFKVHPIETSEFMKSGGSVFCMKMMCY